MKIEMKKETGLMGKVRYWIYNDGWPITNSTDYEEARQIYETCVENLKKGYPQKEIIERYEIYKDHE